MAEPTLYVVATPIGNLRDITLRALDTLKSVDAIAAEDTRVSRKLLAHFGIQADLIPAHEHNERDAAKRLVALLSRGKSVALISDAGTPAISDPGAIVVAQVRAAGFRVVSVPGPSAITTAIAAAGLQCASFCFRGFLPARKGERERMLAALKAQYELQVFYEAPHRIVECIASIAAVFGGDRRIGIARELTKLFEQVHVCRLDEAVAWLERSENHRRGEFVLLVEGCPEAAGPQGESDPQRVLEILLQELPLKQAVRLAAEITGTKKNALYKKALKLKKESSDEKK
ncbi:MAG: 16S rRNA (cytidine(1402)-2'-O)-methyltransferase [Betaproteobacteria bacterium]|nr:16S rRNA (cytidine(1402)-2'-O)-methyltransferase [Betaproteobacteria bacterium]